MVIRSIIEIVVRPLIRMRRIVRRAIRVRRRAIRIRWLRVRLTRRRLRCWCVRRWRMSLRRPVGVRILRHRESGQRDPGS